MRVNDTHFKAVSYLICHYWVRVFKFAIGMINNDILIAVTVRIGGKMCVRVCREYTCPVTTTVTIPLILSFTVRYYSIFSKVDSTTVLEI